LGLSYDLLQDRRIDDVIIGNFFLCFFFKAESFQNLEDILPDWVNDNVEKCLTEAVDKYEKQED